MNIGNYIELKLKNAKKNKKWLNEEINKLLQFDGKKPGSYTWLTEKIKEDNLSSHDLMYIAIILNLDMNKLISICKKQYEKKEEGSVNHMEKFTEIQKTIITNSAFKTDVAKRTFVEKDGVKYLLSYDIPNKVQLEKIIYDNEVMKIRTICLIDDSNLENELGELEIELNEFVKISDDDKFNIIYGIGEDFMSMFPEEYDLEYPEIEYSL